MRRQLGALAMFMLLAVASPALSQTRPADADVFRDGVYAGAGNALQMLERTPGFTFQRGGEDDPNSTNGKSRANVLIDGRSLAGGETADAVLRRIPAFQIDRIELVRAGAGVEMMGHSLLANIIRRQAPAAGLVKANLWKGGVTVSTTALPGSQTGFSLAADGQRRRDRRTFDAGMVLSEIPTPGARGVRVRTAASGTAGPVRFDAYTLNTRAEARAGYDTPLGDGRLRLNGLITQTSADLSAWETQAGGAIAVRASETDQTRIDGSARYSRPLSPMRQVELRLNQQLMQTATASANSSGAPTFRSDRLSGVTGTTLFIRHAPKDATWELGFQGDHAWQAASSTYAGLESAHRDTAAFYLSARRAIFEHVDVDAALWGRHVRLGGETSGDSAFSYLSPRLSFAGPFGRNSGFIASLEHQVLPLNLDNLAAHLRVRRELGDEEELIEGALHLQPEAALTFRLRLEHKFGDGLAFLELIQQERLDIVDLAPTLNGREAYDNIGDGLRQTLVLSLDTPVDERLAVRARATFRSSSLSDPFTGEVRRQSGERPFEWEVGLRQESEDRRLRWGVDASGATEATSWRRTEVSTTGLDPTVTVYLEHLPQPDLVLRGEIRNLTDQRQQSERVLYSSARGMSAPSAVETRVSRTGPVIYLSARRSY